MQHTKLKQTLKYSFQCSIFIDHKLFYLGPSIVRRNIALLDYICRSV